MAPAAQQIWLTRPTQTKLKVAEAKTPLLQISGSQFGKRNHCCKLVLSSFMSGCSCLAEAKNLVVQMAPAAQQIWLTRPTQTKLEVAEAKNPVAANARLLQVAPVTRIAVW